MSTTNKLNSIILGICLILGLSSLGYLLADAAIKVKEYERSVKVKGLSEKEFPADIVIWPITFTTASNSVTEIYDSIDSNSEKIRAFLEKAGINNQEITFASPAITDKSAQQYGNQSRAEFRYTASQSVTVYSKNIELVQKVMGSMSELGKQGIVFSQANYQSQTEYLFTRLNEIKPMMIEEATRKAREVAEKFASDSKSTLSYSISYKR